MLPDKRTTPSKASKTMTRNTCRGVILAVAVGSYDIAFSLATVALFGAALASYVIKERRYSMRYVVPITSPS